MTLKGSPSCLNGDDSDQKFPVQITSTVSSEIDPDEERAFVWRLDIGFLTIGFLGYMFKYVDQTNIVSAHALTILSESELTTCSQMPMFLVWKKISRSMEMSSTTLPPFSSTFLPSLRCVAILISASIGYMIMLYPSCIIISHFGPSKWLPACEVSCSPFSTQYRHRESDTYRLSGEC